jgi:hypothetical protein
MSDSEMELKQLKIRMQTLQAEEEAIKAENYSSWILWDRKHEPELLMLEMRIRALSSSSTR